MQKKKDEPVNMGAKGYKITMPEGSTFTGVKKYVSFSFGVGVLCPYGLAKWRPDWVARKGGGWVQVGGPGIEHYADYFKDMGCEVKEMPEDEAQKLYDELETYPGKFRPAPMGGKKEEKAKAKAKAKPTEKPKGEGALPHEK